MEKSPIKVLVTVGTTEFDPLILYTSSPCFLSLLASALPQPALTYQIGARYFWPQSAGRWSRQLALSSASPTTSRKSTTETQ